MLEKKFEVATIEIMEKEIAQIGLALRTVTGVYLVPLESNLCWLCFMA